MTWAGFVDLFGMKTWRAWYGFYSHSLCDFMALCHLKTQKKITRAELSFGHDREPARIQTTELLIESIDSSSRQHIKLSPFSIQTGFILEFP